MDMFNESLQSDVRNWWASLLLGILFIAVAVALLFAPGFSYITISAIFSVTIFLSGLLEIFFAISNRKSMTSWGWYLTSGIIDLLIGCYLIYSPLVSMELLPYMLAFWLLFRGFTLCGYSSDLHHYSVRQWGWYLAFGILSIICSLAILWQPVIGTAFIIYMISFSLLAIGVFRFILAFELRSLHKHT